MSELYSGKYAPRPVKVVGHWARRPMFQYPTTLAQELVKVNLAYGAVKEAVVDSIRNALLFDRQTKQFERVFK